MRQARIRKASMKEETKRKEESDAVWTEIKDRNMDRQS